MASFCAFFGHRLYHDYKSKYAKFTSYFFLFLALSSFLGGTSHLLDLYLGKNPHLIAWTIQGVSVLFFQFASLSLLRQSKLRFILKGLIYAFFILFVFQVFSVQHFDVVKVNSIVGLMGVVSIIHIYKGIQEKDIAYLRIPLALILFAGPAMIHSFAISYN